MKESYKEGDARHFGCESGLGETRGGGEALTGEGTGGLLSSEITPFRMPTRLSTGKGHPYPNKRFYAQLKVGTV